MSSLPVRVGLIGCGMVAEEYAATLALSSQVRLHGCADPDAARAARLAQRYHAAVRPLDEILDPTAIDLAVILTPPHTHTALARQSIAAGVPAVWVEKPLALVPENADDLVAAAEEANVLLAAAPDTPLGPAQQSAARALNDGLIGVPLSATSSLLSTGPERWHHTPEPFYAEGAGPLGDMGPYYLAALDQLLGPLSVRSATAHLRSERRIRSGQRAGAPFPAQAPTYVAALLESLDNVPITFTASFDAVGTRAPHLEIHGSDGTLALPDPNFHQGDVLHHPYDSFVWDTLPQGNAQTPLGRGMGVLDLAAALRTGGQPQCSPQRAARTAHLTQQILHAATSGQPRPQQDDFAPATAL